MDILNATRPAARVERLHTHLRELLRITATSWDLPTAPVRLALPHTQPGIAAIRRPPPALRA